MGDGARRMPHCHFYPYKRRRFFDSPFHLCEDTGGEILCIEIGSRAWSWLSSSSS